MLSKCANPLCEAPFRHLREGKLIRVEHQGQAIRKRPASVRTQRPVEYYWLCGGCSPNVTLVFDKQQGLVIVPLLPPRSA